MGKGRSAKWQLDVDLKLKRLAWYFTGILVFERDD